MTHALNESQRLGRAPGVQTQDPDSILARSHWSTDPDSPRQASTDPGGGGRTEERRNPDGRGGDHLKKMSIVRVEEAVLFGGGGEPVF